MFKITKDDDVLPLPVRCPSTGKRLIVTELFCPESKITIRGRFQLNPLTQLTPEDEYFILEFLRLRGNLKAMGNELKVSYPTIRARFDGVLKRIGLESISTGEEEVEADAQVDSHEVLERLAKREISTDDAIRLLTPDMEK